MSTFTPLLAQLRHAVALAEQIESLQAELASVMSDSFAGVPAAAALVSMNGGPKAFRHASSRASTPKVNRVSPEGRAKIAEAQKRRWAKWRQA